MRPVAVLIALISLLGMGLVLSADGYGAEATPSTRPPTEQENAAEKFFSALEASLAEKFFDARQRPVIRVAVFDFTDGKGNGVGAGKELAEKITRRLHRQSQFEVVSPKKLQRYLALNGMNTMGRLDAPAFSSFRRRVNTLDPGHGIHALVIGEVQKGMSRNLRVTASIFSFEAPMGALETGEEPPDLRQVQAEIPYPTEKALQEATEVTLANRNRHLREGRLVVLANTRGNHLLATAQTQAFGADKISLGKGALCPDFGERRSDDAGGDQGGIGSSGSLAPGIPQGLGRASGTLVPPRKIRNQRNLFR